VITATCIIRSLRRSFVRHMENERRGDNGRYGGDVLIVVAEISKPTAAFPQLANYQLIKTVQGMHEILVPTVSFRLSRLGHEIVQNIRGRPRRFLRRGRERARHDVAVALQHS
jgi:hypothetical protein